MFSFRRKMSCEVARSMGSGQETQEVGVKERQNKQLLAHAVKSIQWSYAIFWSISSTQPGVLEWGEGYYNGDIKTRKKVEAIELNDEQLRFQRTEQLRELYESLSADETNPQPKRPSASLSPEDLTDTEWYFLVSMSFFKIGQELPGRTLASNQTIWLSDAHYADSKLFSRSLLAKSASIKTVVCFPYLEGVVELGATDLILEDKSIIRHIKSSFFKIPSPIVPKIPGYFTDIEENDKSFPFIEVDHNILDTNLNRVVECEEVNIICSTNNSSNSFRPNQQDEMSNSVQIPMDSSDYTSQSFSTPKEIVPLSNGEYNDTNQTSFDLQDDDIHYQSVLSTLLKTSGNPILGPHSQISNKNSGFVNWKKGGSSGGEISQGKIPQRVLKKVLFEVARMHGGCLTKEENAGGDKLYRPEVDETDTNHVLSERRRRERINERFLVLRSLVPSSGKFDKVYVLDGTIEYLKELKIRFNKLESCKKITELEARTRRKPCDVSERTYYNYGKEKKGNNKRKACDIEEMRTERNQSTLTNSSTNDVHISKIERNVLIEMRCFWRENLLLEIIDEMSNLHLDSQSVQSSNIDGILSLTIKAKLKGSMTVSTTKIKQSLEKLTQNC